MASSLVFVLAIAGGLVNALAFDAPQPTKDVLDWGRGWSPAPTNAPNSPAELVKRNLLAGRQLASTILVAQDQTCGYLSGSAGAAYTCGGVTSTCNLLPPAGTQSLGAVACCANGLCHGRLYCINSADYRSGGCNDDCEFNTFTLKCTQATAPYCNTAVWAGVSVRDVYCAARSVSSVQTITTTYLGQTVGGRFTPLVLEDDVITTSSTRSVISTTSSSRPPTTTTPTRVPPTTSPVVTDPLPTFSPVPPEKKSTPIGAIVGGAVGGVAVLALISFGLWFIRRRNRKDKTAAAAVTSSSAAVNNNHNSQPPPPVYLPPQSEMDGAGVVGKPAMTQTQEDAGYFAPAAAPKAHEYQQQQQQQQQQFHQQQFPQQHNNSDILSPGTSTVGTYDPRRDSTLTPISPQSGGSVGGSSPQMTSRESYVSTGYPPPPPPASAGGYQVHEVSGQGAYEMPGSPVRKPVGGA